MQDAHILRKLRDTDYRVTVEGNSVMDVNKMLGREGINKEDTYKLPESKLQKWNQPLHRGQAEEDDCEG